MKKVTKINYEEVKKLKTLYKNQRAEALEEHYRKKFSLGDFSSLTEKNIAAADDDERNAMMKAWNYMHPSKKEMREQIEGKKSAGQKGDPDYYEKLKKAWKAQGVELPDNPNDIDWNKPPFSKWMNRYGFGDSGEKFTGDGTYLTIDSSNDLHLTATTDINVPQNVGMTFGDDGEKIEGD